MLARVNPARQAEFTAKPINAFRKGFPTLTDIASAYNPQTAGAWLVAELTNLTEFSGGEGATPETLTDTARTIYASYPHLMLSELLLFFGWFKAGRYGKFYGAVDPLTITNALRDFMVERGNYKAQIYAEAAEKERTRAGISYAEHCRINGISPENADLARDLIGGG